MFRCLPSPARRAVERARPLVLLVAMVVAVGCAAPNSPNPVEDATPGPDAGCRGQGSPATRSVVYRDDLAGVDANLVSLDLSVPVVAPSCEPVPLVVYVHGGAFSLGDKANRITDKQRLFTDEGWAFASVNYRLSPSPPDGDPNRVRHPDHIQDVAAAVGWLAEHAEAQGIDAGRISLIGHSAGAFLVALAATDLHHLAAAGVDASQLRCVVPLDTRYDPRTEAEGSPLTEAMYRNALGDDPAAWDQASPLRLARPKAAIPDFLIVTRGSPARVAANEDFAAALRRARVPVTVLDANPLDHAGVNAAVGAPGESLVTPAVMDFLRECHLAARPRPKG